MLSELDCEIPKCSRHSHVKRRQAKLFAFFVVTIFFYFMLYALCLNGSEIVLGLRHFVGSCLIVFVIGLQRAVINKV